MFKFLKYIYKPVKNTTSGRMQLPVINSNPVGKPTVFRAPPIIPDLIDAIRLISPHCELTTNQESRLYWERDQNAACWGEDEVFSKYFSHYTKPRKILEIGPGLGRSVIFLAKRYKLEKSTFNLYESNGRKTKYTINGPRSSDSFCGTITQLRRVLRYNKITNYRIFDAMKLGDKLSNLPEKYDLIYSFYAIGFHWSFRFFINELLNIMKDNSVGFFIVPSTFRAFKRLKTVHYKAFSFTSVLPADKNNKMLVISKRPLKI